MMIQLLNKIKKNKNKNINNSIVESKIKDK